MIQESQYSHNLDSKVNALGGNGKTNNGEVSEAAQMPIFSYIKG